MIATVRAIYVEDLLPAGDRAARSASGSAGEMGLSVIAAIEREASPVAPYGDAQELFGAPSAEVRIESNCAELLLPPRASVS